MTSSTLGGRLGAAHAEARQHGPSAKCAEMMMGARGDSKERASSLTVAVAVVLVPAQIGLVARVIT
eukprot:607745-Rhodomonas_salina.1